MKCALLIGGRDVIGGGPKTSDAGMFRQSANETGDDVAFTAAKHQETASI